MRFGYINHDNRLVGNKYALLTNGIWSRFYRLRRIILLKLVCLYYVQRVIHVTQNRRTYNKV